MTPITEADVREWSDLNFNRLGFSDASKLQRVVDRASGYVFSITGLSYATAETGALALGPDDPSLVVSLLGQAIQMRTEQVVMQGRADYIESAAQNDVISSFSVGSYSESHRDPTRRGEGKSINLWPALDEILWMLMTPERFAWWRAYISGEAAPDWSVVPVDWNRPGGLLHWFEPWDTLLPSVESF